MHEYRFVYFDRHTIWCCQGPWYWAERICHFLQEINVVLLRLKKFANGSAGHPRLGGHRPPSRYITALRSKGQGKLARCRCSGFAHKPADLGQKVRAPVMLGPRFVKFHWGVILHGSCKAHESFSTSTTLRTFLLWRVTVQIHKNNGCHSNSRIIP